MSLLHRNEPPNAGVNDALAVEELDSADNSMSIRCNLHTIPALL